MLGNIGVLALALLFLSACVDSPPAIGGSLDGPLIGIDPLIGIEFDRAVKARFPVGSSDASLRAELMKERFIVSQDSVEPAEFVARYEVRALECRTHWTIVWSVYESKIASERTGYRRDCL